GRCEGRAAAFAGKAIVRCSLARSCSRACLVGLRCVRRLRWTRNIQPLETGAALPRAGGPDRSRRERLSAGPWVIVYFPELPCRSKQHQLPNARFERHIGLERFASLPEPEPLFPAALSGSVV